MYMVGAMALQIQGEFSIGLERFTLLSTIYYSTTFVSLLAGGWLAELIGSAVGIRLALVVDGFVLLGIGTVVRSFWGLALLLVCAGMINSIAQQAVNLHMVGNVPRAIMGTAFGIKQSAVPGSTLLAGLAVPLLGVTLGWRSAFVFTGVFALVSILMVRGANIRLPRVRGRRPDSGITLLVLLGGVTALASGSAVSVGIFTVIAAKEVGLSEATGGTILAAGSLACIVTRMLSGKFADRFPNSRFRILSVLMLIGGCGISLLALGQAWSFAVGVIIGLGFGWGWPAVFVLLVVTMNPSAPAVSAALTQMGSASGSIAGPFAFGLVAARYGFGPAWLMAATAMGIAAAALIPLQKYGLRSNAITGV